MTTTRTSPTIALDVHICDQRRTYRVEFFGESAEDSALKFVSARRSTHAIFELEDEPIGQEFTRLYDLLYPTCEHGLSLSLCSGPNHYPAYDEERRRAGY